MGKCLVQSGSLNLGIFVQQQQLRNSMGIAYLEGKKQKWSYTKAVLTEDRKLLHRNIITQIQGTND